VPTPAGLQAFDMPLTYIHKDQLNQPIFGCNNLAGEGQKVFSGSQLPGSWLCRHHLRQ
jgi:hypothetical protein